MRALKKRNFTLVDSFNSPKTDAWVCTMNFVCLVWALFFTIPILAADTSTVKDYSNPGANDIDYLQAGLVHPNGKIYFFRRVFYHAYDFGKKELLELNRIGKPSWAGTDIYLDAAMTDKKRNQAFLFKGNIFYRYSFGQRRVVQKGIIGRDYFQGVTGPIDAAYWVSGGENAFIFQGDEFLLWNSTTRRIIQRGKIGEKYFKGVPKNVDAAIRHPNGKEYFFKGDMYYRYDSTKKRTDKRGRIGKDEWPGVYPSLDAAFDAGLKSQYAIRNQKIDIVKDKHVYLSADRWPSRKEKEGNWFTRLPIFIQSAPKVPEPVQELKKFRIGYEKYPGVPPGIDAVCVDDRANETLFFKQNRFYIFDNHLNRVKKVGAIGREGFSGVPYNVDAAFFQGSFIWFFKGNKYYKYMPKAGKVLSDGYIRNYFKGVPDNLDGAVLFHGRIRFYKHTVEYIYDQNQKRVVDTNGVR
ncbi:hemopexin repeat-containing protein [Robiginitalea sp. IMCC44478]|uniref:hemopexin repeat-containing protein n=1 Tax=Robiginitalea sp. IMCC44478 TaxID=3459122 RepID=UPI0040418910